MSKSHSILLEVTAHNLGRGATDRVNERLGLPTGYGEAVWLAWGDADDVRTTHWHRVDETDQVQVSTLRSGRRPANALAAGDVLAAIRAEMDCGGWRGLAWASGLACARAGLWDVIETKELVEAFRDREPDAALAWLGRRHQGKPEVEALLIRNFTNYRRHFVEERDFARKQMSRQAA